MVTCLTHGDSIGGRRGWGVSRRGWGVGGAKRLGEGRVQTVSKMAVAGLPRWQA